MAVLMFQWAKKIYGINQPGRACSASQGIIPFHYLTGNGVL
jgi:hypothetical protein